MQIGIDIGSISIGAIFLQENRVVQKFHLPHKGDIVGTLKKIVTQVSEPTVNICVTGKDLVLDPSVSHDIIHLDPIVAMTDAACHLYPEVSHILYIGGETYTLIHLKNGRLQNYLSNSSCASGTGAFLEQQAMRLGMDIVTFAEYAAQFQGVPPRVATRCAVFAKSDIIHLQQEGTPVVAIAAGLCESLVEGLMESLLKGNKLAGLTVIAGGVALNRRVVESLSRHVEKLAVSEYAPVLGAYGSAMYARQSSPVNPQVLMQTGLGKDERTRPSLVIKNSDYPDFTAHISQKYENTEITVYRKPAVAQAYLGIDIGSTSTKAVVTSREGNIWLGFYTRTGGKPIEAAKCILRCLDKFCQENDWPMQLQGIGTTGSGRKLMKNVMNGDFEVNEITAHAKAAIFLYPEVDTIIEIGGQDAKFTRIAYGAVTNAVMNYVCAAGTGSFIEEQAKRLNIPLEQMSAHALQGRAPITSERCTVYMERDINRLIRQGWVASDVAAAVIYSVRDNYLNKVVAGAQIGEHVIFQGATARNQALVAAFEQYLQKTIKVFPYAHLTGALGVCLLMREENIHDSAFRWCEFIDMPIKLQNEVCELCHNKCRLTVVETPRGREGYGMMCGRDYGEQKYVPIKRSNFNFMQLYNKGKSSRGKVLIPCALAMFEYHSLWESFFHRLGFTVETSKTSQRSFDTGKQLAHAEFCAPLLTAQGLIWEAAQENVDMVFFPVFYKEAQQGPGESATAEGAPNFFCYYTSHLPSIIYTQLPQEAREKFAFPLLQMDTPQEAIADELMKHLKRFGLEREEVTWAYQKAQQEYTAWKQANIEDGRKILAQIQTSGIGLVVLGRPYNTFDGVMNANVVDKLVRMGYPTIYYDMLEIPAGEDDALLSRIHWNYGKKIYRAARYIAQSDNLFPIYLTSFRCSPDAFIMSYFKFLMDHFKKPYLIIQLDEHCSDVGYLTRIEAAIDSFKSWRKEAVRAPSFELAPSEVSFDKTILIPHVDEIASRLVAAAFQSYGYKAMVLEESTATVFQGFRYTLGGECLAIAAIAGGIVKTIEKHQLDPEKTLVFLPSSYIACNFPQIPVKVSIALSKAGMPVKVINTSSFSLLQRLLSKLDLVLWDTLIVSHTLRQLGCSLRPYEVNKGETDSKMAQAVQIMEEAILQKKNKNQAWEQVAALFGDIKVKRDKRPRVLITGDLYVRNNDAFNQNVVQRIEELGGEAFLSSIIEYSHYALELVHYGKEQNLTQLATYYVTKKILESWEQSYMKPVQHLFTKLEEPSWDTMFKALQELGIDIGVQGETALTISRAMCLARAGQIAAVVHINPSFCCAGNVSVPFLEKIREDFNISVLNIFYDGTDQPNSSLVPFMHYLCQQSKVRAENGKEGIATDTEKAAEKK
jgi:predicted CoA-substrate-specific enzyme activase